MQYQIKNSKIRLNKINYNIIIIYYYIFKTDVKANFWDCQNQDYYRGGRYKVQGGGVYKVQGEGVYKVQGFENFSEKGRL